MSSSKNIKWDESQSPQWRYLLSQESRARKGLVRKKKSIEEITGEGEIKRNKQSVRASHKKMRKEDRTSPPSSSSKEDLGLTKKGKKIVYSASPGRGRYTNSNTTPTNHNNNNDNDETTRLPTGTEEQE